MIDKYKLPRSQRSVPERTRLRALRRYATPCLLLASALATSVRHVLVTEMAQAAGAMPGEFDPMELRFGDE